MAVDPAKTALEKHQKCPGSSGLHPTTSHVEEPEYARELAARGYVTLTPNYPLLGQYAPDLKGLGWHSGTMKAIWDTT